jgi:hypothetical protein
MPEYMITMKVKDPRRVLTLPEGELGSWEPELLFPFEQLKNHGVFARASARRNSEIEVQLRSIERVQTWDVWPFEDPKDYWAQTDYWTDARGRQNPIEHMSLDYIANVLYMLHHEAYKVWRETPRKDVLKTPLAKALEGRMANATFGAVQTPVPADAYSRA